ncbi:MarR family winged helix-turn-helix transcriptional regulator [Actinomycetospora straminea]|uniref:MarR family transcriptional regulator n=1 Tax=Actinomycetospora straminea TaxID=663607 RepID=A0ABP9F780_9PSEU|nr:MarR family transcriptional regulator [Actinomycetospora straminea]MDD7934812.1 MarR family transcriptional regulator [Actinomycetospora straminea]
MEPDLVLDKVFELADRVGDLMHSTLKERGLTPARAGALLALHKAGRALRQRELGDVLRCTPRHVTALVDVLEAQGWAGRSAHPTDRRATLVALTDRGAEAAAQMAAERQDAARTMFGDLTEEERDGFLAVARRALHGMATLSEDRATSS